MTDAAFSADAARVAAIVPAHNEASRIAATVRGALTVPGVSRVLVVDDGSTDATPALAEEAGADVLRLRANAGKGAAVAAGLAALAADPAGVPDITLMLDADLGETASLAGRLVGPVARAEADMTVAVLPKPPGSGGFGLVLRLARRGIREMTGWEPRAPLSGQRALSAAAVAAAGEPAPGFGLEVAMTVRVLGAGLRVTEVEVPMRHAATGKDLSGFVHRGRQYADLARALRMLRADRRRRNR